MSLAGIAFTLGALAGSFLVGFKIHDLTKWDKEIKASQKRSPSVYINRRFGPYGR